MHKSVGVSVVLCVQSLKPLIPLGMAGTGQSALHKGLRANPLFWSPLRCACINIITGHDLKGYTLPNTVCQFCSQLPLSCFFSFFLFFFFLACFLLSYSYDVKRWCNNLLSRGKREWLWLQLMTYMCLVQNRVTLVAANELTVPCSKSCGFQSSHSICEDSFAHREIPPYCTENHTE